MATKLDKSALTRDLMNNSRIVHLIDREIAKGEFEFQIPPISPKTPDDAWHPSSDCLPSAQDLYDSIKHPEAGRPLPASTRKSFFIGHAVHHYLQYIVTERLGFADPSAIEAVGIKGWGRKSKGQYKPYHWVRGQADLAPVYLPGDPDPWIIDVKTASTFDFRQNGLPKAWAAKYYLQLQIYLHIFEIEKGLFVFFLKDSPHEMREVPVFYNPVIAHAIIDKWKLVADCLRTNEPPQYDIPLNLEGLI